MRQDYSPSAAALLETQRRYFESGVTRSIDFRLRQLNVLKQAVRGGQDQLLEALQADLHKSEYEAFTTEIGILYGDIGFCLKNLRKWVRPRRVPTPLTLSGTRSLIMPEPLGAVLIIGPFNYPVNLVMEPLIGALAAGNCAVIKPSARTPRVAEVLARLLGDCFPPEYVSVVDPVRERTADLIQAPFDHIFFTGSPEVGRVVMQAAAINLTPVTLELGGKSPCIVDAGADIDNAARKIVWGKFTNAGQTCVAPDYLVVHRQIKDPLIAGLRKYIEAFYGADPARSADFGRLIDSRETARLASLIDPARTVIGGDYDIQQCYLAPTVMNSVQWGDAVMREELFGPLLPVLEFEDLDEVIRHLRQRPSPLALYVFTASGSTGRKVIESLSFGGGCVNDVMLHLGNCHLPFGGVGASGMGAYHGRKSFETFSHYKSILRRSFNIKALMPFPPYNAKMLGMVKKFMR